VVVRLVQAQPGFGSLMIHFTDAMPDARGVFTVKRDAFDELVPKCDLCLVVSGTATLHVAGFGIPMIVVYAGKRLLWNAVGRFLIRTRTFALVNLLADPNPTDPHPDRHLVREFIPWCGPTAPVAERLLTYLHNPAELSKQHNALNRLIGTLDRPGASDNVSRIALEMAG
jgi:lipid A disaccharide synthetase